MGKRFIYAHIAPGVFICEGFLKKKVLKYINMKYIKILILFFLLTGCTIDIDLVEECEFFEHVVRDDLGRIVDIYYEEVCYY